MISEQEVRGNEYNIMTRTGRGLYEALPQKRAQASWSTVSGCAIIGKCLKPGIQLNDYDQNAEPKPELGDHVVRLLFGTKSLISQRMDVVGCTEDYRLDREL